MAIGGRMAAEWRARGMGMAANGWRMMNRAKNII
jgi:hypothetical protein